MIPFVLNFRKAREEAISVIEGCIFTPAPESHREEPMWSLGKWRANNSESSSEDEPTESENNVFKVYNEAMANIASVSKKTAVEPLTFRLTSEWDEATEKEKSLCIEQVGEACRAECAVIAPKDSDKLLQAFQESGEVACSSDLKALLTAYKNAPTRNIKTQILSIYADRYPAKYLRKIYAPDKLRMQELTRSKLELD